jgi:hypothetical protein
MLLLGYKGLKNDQTFLMICYYVLSADMSCLVTWTIWPSCNCLVSRSRIDAQTCSPIMWFIFNLQKNLYETNMVQKSLKCYSSNFTEASTWAWLSETRLRYDRSTSLNACLLTTDIARMCSHLVRTSGHYGMSLTRFALTSVVSSSMTSYKFWFQMILHMVGPRPPSYIQAIGHLSIRVVLLVSSLLFLKLT